MTFKVCGVVSAQELILAGEGAGSWAIEPPNPSIEYPPSHLLSQIYIFFDYI